MASRGEVSYLATYNSLLDEHLSEYLSRPNVWRHLRRQGLVRRSGEVVGEEEWRAGLQRRDVRERMDRERLRGQQRVRVEDTSRKAAKHKHKQQLMSNYAVADRIRLQAERHHPAYVREQNFTPLSETDSHALGLDRKQLTVHLPNSLDKPTDPLTHSRTTLRTNSHPSVSQSSHSTCVSSYSLRSLPRQSPYMPRPPAPSSSKRPHPTATNKRRGVSHAEGSSPTAEGRGRGRGRRVIRQVQGGTPNSQSKASITLLFRGRGIRLNGRTVRESRSDVSVYQQHCGGNAVEVFQGQLVPGSRFSFVSRRHLNATLGLNFYLNGLVDTRLSACCECRYKPGHRVGGGGKASHYEVVSVSGATPCFRCQAEIEVDKFIAAGESSEKIGKGEDVNNREIREAWVNTSYVNVSAREERYSSSEFDDASGAASDSEHNSDPIGNKRSEKKSVSRRSSVSSCSSSQGTSSVTLDSDLDATQSDSEAPAAPKASNFRVADTPSPHSLSRASDVSLGHVTPDERLLTLSALSGNPPVRSELLHTPTMRDNIETEHRSMGVGTCSLSPTATSTPLLEATSPHAPPDTLSPLQHSDTSHLPPDSPLTPANNAGADSSVSHSEESRSKEEYEKSQSPSDINSTSKEVTVDYPTFPLSAISSPPDHNTSVVSVSTNSPEVNTSYLDTNTPAHLISSATSTNASSRDVTISSSSDPELDAEEAGSQDQRSLPYSITGGSLVILRNLTPHQFQDLVALLSKPSINKLVIEHTRNFTPAHLDGLFEHTSVSQVLITDSELTSEQLTVLSRHLKYIVALEISHSVLTPDHFNIFLNELPTSAPKLTTFNTSHCSISFTLSLTQILNSLERLEVVNLSGNVLKNAINFPSLRLPRLQELHLDSTSLEEEDLIGLCEFLRSNATIHTLSLRDNLISNLVLQRLLDMLQENKNIRTLHFTPQTEDQQTQHINTKLITDILDKRVI